MSADHWARCPRCFTRETAKLEARRAEVVAAYGKIPVEQFDAHRGQLAEHETAIREMKATFREDYEIFGAETGAVTVSYSGECINCGLRLRFTDTRSIPGIEDPP